MASRSRTSLAAGGAATLVAAAAVILVALTHDWSRTRIAANDRARLTARLHSVLEPALRDRDLRIASLTATDAALLGSDMPVDVFIVLVEGRPIATVIASIAPSGYNGPINLLVGISSAGAVTGVRAMGHRETPGLGGTIDADAGAWAQQFADKTIGEPPIEGWNVRADAGAFDALSGATVTSRAAIAAVRDALLYFGQHRNELYRAAIAAPADDASND